MPITTLFFSACLGLTPLFLNGQWATTAQWNNWCFGDSMSLTFSGSGTPTLGQSSVFSDGKTSSYSNPSTGTLLFYSNGEVAYGLDHLPLSNGTGLLGNHLAQNNSHIVPNPQDPNRYYLVTSGDWLNNPGLYYSEVDMTMNGGLGGVISSSKNTLVRSVASEISCIIPGSNSNFWLILRPYGASTFVVHEIAASGFNLSPQNSTVGSPQTIGTGTGSLNASIGGNWISVANNGMNMIEIYPFDKTTGMVGPPALQLSEQNAQFAEWSPNDSLLYVVPLHAIDSGYQTLLLQYDLSSWDSTTVQNSRFVVDSIATNMSLPIDPPTLGPDGKIYVGHIARNAVNTINNPNGVGNSCDYQIGSITAYAGPFVNLYWSEDMFTNSVFEEGLDAEYKLWPNPSSGSSWLTIPKSKQNDLLDIKWFTYDGRLILHEFRRMSGRTIELDGNQLQKGLYLIQIGVNGVHEQSVELLLW